MPIFRNTFRTFFVVSLLAFLMVAGGCPKEWREDADRTYQNELQRCREFGCTPEELSQIGAWYRAIKAAIISYEMAQNAADREAARKLIQDLFKIVPQIEIKLGNSEVIGDDELDVDLDLISDSGVYILDPSTSLAMTNPIERGIGQAIEPIEIGADRFILNGLFSRTFEGYDSIPVDATWTIAGQLRLGDAVVRGDGTERFAVKSGSFIGQPVASDEQIPVLIATVDTSSERYIQHNLDDTYDLVVTFKIVHEYEDQAGDTYRGGAVFYSIEMPVEPVGDSYRITTDGTVYGDQIIPFVPYPCADWNGDGSLNALDVSAFLTDFNNGSPYTDIDGDGALTSSDATEWANFFIAN